MNPLFAKIIYVVGYWIANFVIRAPHIKVHQRAPIRANRKTWLDSSLFFAVGVGGFLVPLLYVFTPLLAFASYAIPLWIGVTGVALLALGDWVFWRSHKDLGRNWSPRLEIRESHRLVTEGIYRRIRHPMYSSIWLLVIAQAMILPNYVAGFSGLVPFALLYFLRVGKEEKMMGEDFGGEYEQYQRKTGRLFPKLWGD
jgi:protein-S-isoprenylcysteine O-methyltransferase Ste14